MLGVKDPNRLGWTVPGCGRWDRHPMYFHACF